MSSFITIPAHSADATIVAAVFSNKHSALIGSASSDNDIHVYSTTTKETVVKLTHTVASRSLCFDKKDQFVLSGNCDGTIVVWDILSAKPARICAARNGEDPIQAVDSYPYGELFASGSANGVVRVWDIRTKNPVQTHRTTGTGATVVKFNPEGKWLMSGHADGSLKVWDMLKGQVVQNLTTHTKSVTAVAFHPSERMVCTGDADGRVHLWDIDAHAAFELASSATTANAVSALTVDDAVHCVSDASLMRVERASGGEWRAGAQSKQQWRNARAAVRVRGQTRVLAEAADGALCLWTLDEQRGGASTEKENAGNVAARRPAEKRVDSLRGTPVEKRVDSLRGTPAEKRVDSLRGTPTDSQRGTTTDSLRGTPLSEAGIHTPVLTPLRLDEFVSSPPAGLDDARVLAALEQNYDGLLGVLAARDVTAAMAVDALRDNGVRAAMDVLAGVQGDDALLLGALDALRAAVATGSGGGALAMSAGVLALCADVLCRATKEAHARAALGVALGVARRCQHASRDESWGKRCHQQLMALLALLRCDGALACEMTPKVSAKRAELLQLLAVLE